MQRVCQWMVDIPTFFFFLAFFVWSAVFFIYLSLDTGGLVWDKVGEPKASSLAFPSLIRSLVYCLNYNTGKVVYLASL